MKAGEEAGRGREKDSSSANPAGERQNAGAAAIDHILVPEHEILHSDEAKALLEKLKVKTEQIPKIFSNDPAIQYLNPKLGDIIRITRKSATAGTATYYRLVIESENVATESEE